LVMTYNIWNWNSNWPNRRNIITKIINKLRPHVIGLQEIRERFGDEEGSQVEQLGVALPQYNYVYQPAMRYSEDEEGVAVMSLFPITSHDFLPLTFVPDTSDFNKRVVLYSLLDSPHGSLDFFVSHFTYSKGPGQMSNALELLKYMNEKQKDGVTQIVVADFNIYPDYEAPTDFLTGKIAYSGFRGNLSDVWELANPDQKGYTFSNLATSELIDRADRILLRGSRLHSLVTTRLGARNTTSNIPASDHLAVLSTLIFNNSTLGKKRVNL